MWCSIFKMNDGRQMEVHYIDTGFPYTVTESFMAFFEGLTHVPVNYAHAASMPDQVFDSPCILCVFGLLRTCSFYVVFNPYYPMNFGMCVVAGIY